MKKLIIVVALCLVLAGCANSIPAHTGPDVSGFWIGLWHGFILPIAFIISLFKPSVGIYETVNTGLTYNLGYVIGVCVLGGTARSA